MLPSLFRSRRATLAMLLVAGPALAGCFAGEEPSDEFAAQTGNGGHYFTAWDYQAATLTHMGEARLAMEIDEVANTGQVRAGGMVMADEFDITLTDFEQVGDDFQSGGVAANFDEHGDSGVGNALLPRMHLLLATWGQGGIEWNKAPLVDPYTGNSTWDVHVMVTDTGVRDDASGKVFKADGATPYDPAEPGDAMIGRDNEAHLVFTSRYEGDALAPDEYVWNGQILEPLGTATYPFAVQTTEATLDITVDTGADPQEIGRWDIALMDPGGNVVEESSVSDVRPVEQFNKSVSYSEAGDWTLRVTAETLPADFTATINVIYPPKPMHYFFWEDVEILQKVVK